MFEMLDYFNTCLLEECHMDGAWMYINDFAGYTLQCRKNLGNVHVLVETV